jgi:ribosomal protein S18 acetylase RimI-like enzyme
MSWPEVTIRRGVAADAELLAEFAARTFSDTFAAANRPEDIAAYLPAAYGVPQQSSELADPDVVTLIAHDANETLAAYAMLRRGPIPDAVPNDAAIEVWRFYVDRPWHGSGLAQRLISAVHTTAASFGARTLWLGVWEKNDRAIAFYEKCGFRIVGEQDFWVGADRQTDHIMVAPVRQR